MVVDESRFSGYYITSRFLILCLVGSNGALWDGRGRSYHSAARLPGSYQSIVDNDWYYRAAPATKPAGHGPPLRVRNHYRDQLSAATDCAEMGCWTTPSWLKASLILSIIQAFWNWTSSICLLATFEYGRHKPRAVVDKLIKVGADVNSGGGYRALGAAARGSHKAIADKLIKASVYIRGSYCGRTPWQEAIHHHFPVAKILRRAGASTV